MHCGDLCDRLDDLLDTAAYADLDASANGLQVGRREREVDRVAVAVDAAEATVEAAREAGADLLLTHHGLVWDGLERVTGRDYDRVTGLVEGDVGLYVSHLPLDGHQKLGNAAGVGDVLGLADREPFGTMGSEYIGQGPLSSRGAVYPASAVHKAASELRERIAQCAGAFLEEGPERIVLRDGCAFSADNPDNCLSFEDLGRKAYYFPGPRKLPKEMLEKHEHLLDVTATWYSPSTPETGTTYTTFCNSADVAVVEVDPEIGSTRILKYVHVHDAGTIIDKQIVDGQIHGGIVQGIGEALSEELRYDEQGRLLNTSLSEYLMPTTMESPDIEVEHMETPSPYTETGSKGMGEAPIIGAKAVILSAIEDALSPFGVEVNDSPATPERVLCWIRESGRTETT